ncbi:MAG: TrmH family RNA methyltransferase [Parachlamydiales bacterium]|jgi:tRNA G18 (ribose-2'-O)-methylase SpoU
MDISEKSFKQLTNLQQHKRCALLLKNLYAELLEGRENGELLALYNNLNAWLEHPFIIADAWTLKTVSDQYHLHLDAAGISHKEHNLLSLASQGDFNPSEAIWPIDIYLDNLRSAHNVGSIIRTTEAFALGTLYFSEKTPFIDNPKVIKTAMGCHTRVNCQRSLELKNLKQPLIAIETSAQAKPLFNFNFPEAFTLAVGNEEYGCSEQTLNLATHIVAIPLRGRKNSLNVANAFSCVAAEIARQKSQG